MDDLGISDIDVLPFYLSNREEFLRWYLVPSRGAVWGTRSSILVYPPPQLAPPRCLSLANNKEPE